MKNVNRLAALAVVAIVATLIVSSASAQRPRPRPRYDSSAEITVKGTVAEVRERGPEGRTRTLLVIKTADQTLNVLVGPSNFVAEKGFKFANGDKGEVTGAKMDFRGNEMMLAREVKKDEETLTLRDAQGRPTWARGQPRGEPPRRR